MNATNDSLNMPPREYFGKYRGQVTDNVDPLGNGRLQVRVPQVLGDVTVWAQPCVPYAGPQLGWYTMPEIDTGVWVEFEAGDPSYPIWTGFFWNDGDIDSADTDPNIKFFRTNKALLRIDDSSGEIVIENTDGSTITFTSNEIVIKSATVKQEASGGKKTNLSSASFKVNDGNMEVL
jgi:uncharacterized protein involved in type VI secretion and phage assembly